MDEKRRRYYFLLISICLVAAVIAIYWPVYNYDFIRYDDPVYVTRNTNIQSGINWKSICWAFTTDYSGMWHPITWLSHTLDYQLFKSWAGGYHLVNVLFHIINTLVLFYVLTLMTGELWASAFVAAAFALHPLHVESVAWIAERKDLLSTLFWLLTMWAYVRYCRCAAVPGAKYYLLAIVFFILGLMSKPMLVTLPFVLLLLDFWPLERNFSQRLLFEKIPFFILSIACCAVTFLVQQGSGAITAVETLIFKTRLNNAIVSYITYITKMIWPGRLAVFYPYSTQLTATKVAGCGILLALISIYFIHAGRRHKFHWVGWLWYLGTLVPVIGIVQSGAQAMADRYSYMTLTGLFIIIAWSTKKIVPKRQYKTLALSTAIILIVLTVVSGRQLKYWKNSLLLFEHAVQVTENNYMMLDNCASILVRQGRLEEAIELCSKSRAIKPDSAAVYNNLGCALLEESKTQQAIECFRTALKYDPNFSEAIFNLAAGLDKQGKAREAVPYFKQALKIAPNNAETRLRLGITLMKLQEYDQALESFDKAIELEPANVAAHGYRGLALDAAGKTDEAIEEIRFVLKVRPDDVLMYRNLGIFLEKQGDIAGAIKAYRAALQIDPDNENLRLLLNETLKKQNGH